jgi:hypothetical protein
MWISLCGGGVHRSRGPFPLHRRRRRGLPAPRTVLHVAKPSATSYGRMSGEPCAVQPDAFVFRDLTLRGFWLVNWFRRAPEQQRLTLVDDLARLIAQGTLHAPIHANRRRCAWAQLGLGMLALLAVLFVIGSLSPSEETVAEDRDANARAATASPTPIPTGPVCLVCHSGGAGVAAEVVPAGEPCDRRVSRPC